MFKFCKLLFINAENTRVLCAEEISNKYDLNIGTFCSVRKSAVTNAFSTSIDGSDGGSSN